jgi:hypothetical protein
MNENPILPTHIFYFFSTSSLPQNFPPSYLPPTNPSPPHSIAKTPETLSGSELGAGELGAGELGARAWSKGAARAGAGPTQDPGKHLFFLSCLFCLFVYGAALHKIRSVAVQLHKQHLLLLLCVAGKTKEEEGDGIALFFFFFFV